MSRIISVKKLAKRYGDFKAVDQISFDVLKGENFGILGPNGAGKTTTLEMMEGLKPITAGKVVLAGVDVKRSPRRVKSKIGVQLQASSFFDHLSLKELLNVFAALYNRKVDAEAILEKVELQEKIKSTVKQLSGGQKQRFSIATALVNDPTVLFLDEPTTGLDPQARRNMWNLVTNINKEGKTIILTTHYMEEAEILCDRIAIMDHAKIIALDTPKNLLQDSGVKSTIIFRTDNGLDYERLKDLPNVTKAIKEKDKYRLITGNAEQTLPALLQFSRDYQANLYNLQLKQPNLEDVFLKLTGKSLRE